jgi:phenylalanyl-tRNA synthetase beta chain
MRVPCSWLAEYCDPGLSPEDLATTLAMSGTEVARVMRVGVPGADGNGALFRIGRVLRADQHPQADTLRVCSVQLAGTDTRTIVCGAPNVAAGEVVLVALPGAVLPDGTKLTRANLRGIESEGMILSEAEVQLGSDAAGIMVLPESLEVGEEAGRYLSLGDDVIEFEVSPNRPDCLSIYGIGREVHAATRAPLAEDPGELDASAEGQGEVGDYLSVTVEDPELCPRFSVRVFTGVEVGPSPLWLKARLVAAGQRPINNVVDITNYVMLLLGQPMHAYDLDRLAGPALKVRRAKEGERLTTLDGEERCFDDDAVLVCDADGPTGIGGIMGGAASEVSETTTTVALEAATWNGPNILTTSSKLALRSEASARFEKQLHPELALRAQRLASRLMVELCGAQLVPGTADVATPPPPAPKVILRSERVEGLLGERIEPGECRALLERLGFSVNGHDGDLDVDVPFYRSYDVLREPDLIEEVARLHGLDKLPATLPSRERAVGGLTRVQRRGRLVEDFLRARGLNEAVTYSFISPDAVDHLELPAGDERRRVLHIANPLSGEQSAMRTTLVPGLLDAARYNLDRDIGEVHLFELGRVFFSNGTERLPEEQLHLGVLLAGDYQAETWRGEAKAPDFYVVKGLLAALLETLSVTWRLAVGGPSFLHPGRAAEVMVGAHEAGWLGEVHPRVLRSFGVDAGGAPCTVLELNLDVVLEHGEEPAYEDVITYPAVFQDIAVVVDEAVEAQTVVECVRSVSGPDLRSVRVFDLYRGEQVGERKKSLALRLEFRAADRTLTDDEIAPLRQKIREALEREIGGTLRE